jgi:hypothetical protein
MSDGIWQDATSMLQVNKGVASGLDRAINADTISSISQTEEENAFHMDARAIRRNWLEKVASHEDSGFAERLARRSRTSFSAAEGQACYIDHRNLCSGGTRPPQLLSDRAEMVVSTYSEDLMWLKEFDDMKMHIYVHNRSSEYNFARDYRLSAPSLHDAIKSEDELKSVNGKRKHPITFIDIPNVGDEAKAYLTHIIEHYEHLPDAIFFVHGHKCAWHSRFMMDSTIREVSRCISHGAFNQSYLNLNTIDDNQCYDPSSDWDKENPRASHVLAQWSSLMSTPLPRAYCMDCCAQFVVSRDAVHRHNRSFYEHLLEAVDEGKTSLEYFWRPIFLQDYGYQNHSHAVLKAKEREKREAADAQLSPEHMSLKAVLSSMLKPMTSLVYDLFGWGKS